MPFLGVKFSLTTKKTLIKTYPIYISVYPSIAPLGAAGTQLGSAVVTPGVVRNRATGATVAGNFLFADSLTFAPPASQKSITMVFAPTSAAVFGYPSSIGFQVPISVNRTTPTISTFPTLSSIYYGIPKSAVTFAGGAASCPGTFSFANTLSKIYAPGIYPSLECVFTPTDTLNFKPVEYLSPYSLTVTRAEVYPFAIPTITGGGLNQPLSSFSFTNPSDMRLYSYATGNLTYPTKAIGYSFSSSPNKIVTGSKSETIVPILSSQDSLYYQVSGISLPMPVTPTAPLLDAWDVITSQSGFSESAVISQNQVSTGGTLASSLNLFGSFANSSGAGSSSGYRWYGKSGILTLENAITNNSYLQFPVPAATNFNKVITGMIPTFFGRNSGGPNQLALLYSEDAFATPGRIVSSDVSVPSAGNNDLSSAIAGDLSSNPVTILAGRIGYFRLYYYGQTSQTSYLLLLGTGNQDIGFTGYEVQQLPNLYSNERGSWFTPGVSSNTSISGNAIQYWIARTVPGHITQASISGFGNSGASSTRPVYIRNGINNFPAVSFSGGQFLSSQNSSPIGILSNSFTVIFVAKFNTADGTIYSEGENGYWLGSISGGAAICEANRNIVIGDSQFPTTNSTVVITARKLPGKRNYLYVNGQLVSNTQGTISPFTNPNDNPLGYQLNSTQGGYISGLGAILNGAPGPVSTSPYFFNGLLGEMFFFDRDLIDSDRIKIEEYLRLKYLPN